MKKNYLFIAFVCSLLSQSIFLSAQTTNCTTHLNNNGQSSITFNVQNTNTFAITLTGISTSLSGSAAGSYTFTLLYNPIAVASSGATWTQGIVGVGSNGWLLGGTQTTTLPATTTPQPCLTGLTINIPAGATYGFGLSCNGTIGYETIATPVVNLWSAGGVNLITGLNVSWGGTAYPSTPGFYPRGWLGCITWISAGPPCTGTPTAPVITTATQTTPACVNGTATIAATNTGAPTGIGYQWEQAPASTGPWTSVTGGVGANTLSYTTAALTTTTWYRVKAICGVNNAPSTAYQVLVGMTPPGAITGITTFCAGSSQSYSIAPVFGATSYTWTLPSGWTGSSTTTSITATAGTASGNVSVVANSPCGPTTASSLAVTPSAGPPQPGAITGNNVVCNGTSQPYSIAAVAGATSYIWTLPSGWTGSSTTTTMNAIPNSTGGNVTVKAVNGCGTSTPASLAVIITTLAPALGAITGSTNICGGSNQIYSVPAVPGVLYYTWTTPNGWTGFSTTNILTTTVSNTGGALTVSAFNGCGNSNVPSQQITITPQVTPAVSISTGVNTICNGTSTTFIATGVNGGASPSYQWKQNGLSVGTNSSTYSSATLSNNDVITCILTSNAACPSTPNTTSNAITMTVNPNVFPGINVNATTSQSICAGASVTFYSNITGGGTAPLYQWMRNTTPVGSNVPTYTSTSLSDGDSVSCILTTNALCPSTPTASSNKMRMHVSQTVNPGAVITASPGTAVTSGAYVTFTATITNGGTQPLYQWAKNGLDQLGETNSTYVTNTLEPGDQISMKLASNAPCAFPIITTSNKLLMHSNTSVKGVSTGDINLTLAPNPNRGQFTIMGEWNDVPKANQMQVEVINTVGQIVYSSIIPTPGQKQWNISINLKDDISNGIYILRLTTDSRNAVKRFEVNR